MNGDNNERAALEAAGAAYIIDEAAELPEKVLLP